MQYSCYICGECATAELPEGSIRAFLICPECIVSGPVMLMMESDERDDDDSNGSHPGRDEES